MLETHPNTFPPYILCKHLLSCQEDQEFSLDSVEHTAHACLNTQLVFACLLYSVQNSLVIYHHDCLSTVHSVLSCFPMPLEFSSSLSTRHQLTIFHFQSSVSSRWKHHREENNSQACGTPSPVAGTGLVYPVPNEPPLENYGH